MTTDIVFLFVWFVSLGSLSVISAAPDANFIDKDGLEVFVKQRIYDLLDRMRTEPNWLETIFKQVGVEKRIRLQYGCNKDSNCLYQLEYIVSMRHGELVKRFRRDVTNQTSEDVLKSIPSSSPGPTSSSSSIKDSNQPQTRVTVAPENHSTTRHSTLHYSTSSQQPPTKDTISRVETTITSNSIVSKSSSTVEDKEKLPSTHYTSTTKPSFLDSISTVTDPPTTTTPSPSFSKTSTLATESTSTLKPAVITGVMHRIPQTPSVASILDNITSRNLKNCTKEEDDCYMKQRCVIITVLQDKVCMCKPGFTGRRCDSFSLPDTIETLTPLEKRVFNILTLEPQQARAVESVVEATVRYTINAILEEKYVT